MHSANAVGPLVPRPHATDRLHVAPCVLLSASGGIVSLHAGLWCLAMRRLRSPVAAGG